MHFLSQILLEIDRPLPEFGRARHALRRAPPIDIVEHQIIRLAGCVDVGGANLGVGAANQLIVESSLRGAGDIARRLRIVVIVERIEIVRVLAVQITRQNRRAALRTLAIDDRGRDAIRVKRDPVGIAIGRADRAQAVGTRLRGAGIGAVAIQADRGDAGNGRVLIILRIDAVDRQLSMHRRLPLQRRGGAQPLIVQILPVDRRQRRDQRVRRNQRIGGRIGPEGRADALVRRPREAEGGRGHAIQLRIAIGVIELADAALIGIDLLLLVLIGDRTEDPERRGNMLGNECGQPRVHGLAILAIFALETQRVPVFLVGERAAGCEIDDGAQRTLVIGGRRGLGDRNATEEFGGESVEIEPAAAVCTRGIVSAAGDAQRVRAVQARLLEIAAQATHRDRPTLAIVAVDRDAGQALDRFREVRIGEIGDVLGGDRVDDLVGTALLINGVRQASAETGHDDIRAAFCAALVRAILALRRCVRDRRCF